MYALVFGSYSPVQRVCVLVDSWYISILTTNIHDEFIKQTIVVPVDVNCQSIIREKGMIAR